MALTDHIRKQVRDAVLLILKGPAITAAGDNVFVNRVAPFGEADLPAINIFTNTESSDVVIEASRVYMHNLTLTIELSDKLSTNVVDILDNIALDVEKIMAKNENAQLGLKCIQEKYPVLVGTEINIKDKVENDVAGIVMSYQIIYHTDEPGVDEQTLVPLEGIDVDFDLDPTDEEIDMEVIVDYS